MTNPPPISVLYQIGTGHYFSSALFTAAEMGIADMLLAGPRSAEDLANECGAHAPSLRRMLRLLVTVGVFTEGDDGCFALTPVGECMTASPVTVDPKDPIATAIRRMEEGGYRHLPVVRDGIPVGILSVKRIVHYLVEHFPATIHNQPPAPVVRPKREGA